MLADILELVNNSTNKDTEVFADRSTLSGTPKKDWSGSSAWRKHMLRFNLRALLIVSLVVGTSLGLYVSQLSSQSMMELTTEDFDEKVLSSSKPVVVLFKAPW